MRFSLALFSLLTTAVLAAPAPEADVSLEERADKADDLKPNPKKIYIKDFDYGGTGCKAGTVAHAISSDRTRMSVIFDSYSAQSGPKVQAKENRKACQLNLKLNIPHGWQYSVFQADHRGFRDITKGSKAYWRASYYFTGNSKTATTYKEFKGPNYGDFTLTNKFGVESTVWSECGGESMLNMKTALNIRPLGTDDFNLIQLDSTDVKFEQVLYFAWRKCPNK